MKLPSVVSLKTYVKPSSHPAFTRFNVFLRDRFSCQYCGSRDDLTFDHLIPRSRGGQTTWGNVVAACSGCNLRKGNLTPHEARMWPSQLPMQPSPSSIRSQRIFHCFRPSYLDVPYHHCRSDGAHGRTDFSSGKPTRSMPGQLCCFSSALHGSPLPPRSTSRSCTSILRRRREVNVLWLRS
jgi:hypothetical protein